MKCTNTYDCGPSYFCWYQNAQDAQTDTKKCLDLYYNTEGFIFGWRYVDANDGMTNALINGQNCQSGFAVYIGNYQAQCSSIKKISSDFGQVNAPYACSVANPSNTCRYYYTANDYLT